MIWLPDMDLNHDKQIQSLLCYRYTIGQCESAMKVSPLIRQSSWPFLRTCSALRTPHSAVH
jgi:hypothetical protein